MSGMTPNDDRSPAMPNSQDTSRGQRGAAQGYPLFAGRESFHANQMRGYLPLPFQSQPMPVQGNAQPHQNDQSQQIYRDQLSFFARQQLTSDARHLLTFLGTNPNTMDGLARLFGAVIDQVGIQGNVHQVRRLPQGSNLAAPGEAPQTHENTALMNAQNDDQGQHTNVSSSAIANQPLPVTDIFQRILDRVTVLVTQPATTYKGYIHDDDEFALYEKAVWKAKRKDVDIGDKCEGYPVDDTGKMRVKDLIFRAIHNMEGEQDPASDSGEFENSVAVKAVKALSGLETEILAHKLMEDMRKVQSGECLLYLSAEYKILQEATFTDKLDQVVEALNYNKPLCRSATMTAEWISRIAADPATERHKKNQNNKNNKDKAGVLKKDAAVRGKSRGKGKKRSAPDESGADTTRESTAEASDAVRSIRTDAWVADVFKNNDGDMASSGGSTKRQRTSLVQTHGEASQQHHGQQARVATPRFSPEQLAQAMQATHDEQGAAQHPSDE